MKIVLEKPEFFRSLEQKFIEHRPAASYGGTIRTAYREAGHGEPLALVHGFGDSSYIWRYNVEALSKSYRVIMPDMVGHGDTDKPLDFDYTPENLCEWLKSFLDAVEIGPFHLVGTSMWGGLSLLFAATYPDITLSVCPVAPAGYDQPYPILFRIAHIGIMGWFMKHFAGRWMVRAFAKAAYFNPDLIQEDEIEEFYRPLSTMQGRMAMHRALKQALTRENARRLETRFKDVKCPALIIIGFYDRVDPPSYGHRYHRDVPNSRLVYIPFSGHVPQEESPAAVNEALQAFLKEVG